MSKRQRTWEGVAADVECPICHDLVSVVIDLEVTLAQGDKHPFPAVKGREGLVWLAADTSGIYQSHHCDAELAPIAVAEGGK